MTETIAYINNSLKTHYPPGEITGFTRLIMEHVCRLQPHHLLLGKDKELSGTETGEVKKIVERLKQFEPIQYILGKTLFYGLPFHVNPSVLIPRPETEELADCAIRDFRDSKARILDIGTGSGCLAVALAKHLPHSDVFAVDISGEALRTARENAHLNQVEVTFLQADILSPPHALAHLPDSFDLFVSNPPYVKESEKAEMGKNVLFFEPPEALFVPDDDPLLFYRAIARLGKEKLKRGGVLYAEINAQCGKATVDLLAGEGYTGIRLIRDIAGKERIVTAKR
ncbi:MAG: peptide chain release factor N(5)-glutamine methyltransferase [Tannerellaceae bacterium]|jgi:release factor glutamine methyltransferase|nr:peptide chain release factor N(5)-glutamine methyltransferase [Tannerellaceae bacterium]